MEAIANLFKKRPTETLTGPALGLAVYGFSTQVGLPPLVAGILAVGFAFVPAAVTQAVVAMRRG